MALFEFFEILPNSGRDHVLVVEDSLSLCLRFETVRVCRCRWCGYMRTPAGSRSQSRVSSSHYWGWFLFLFFFGSAAFSSFSFRVVVPSLAPFWVVLLGGVAFLPLLSVVLLSPFSVLNFCLFFLGSFAVMVKLTIVIIPFIFLSLPPLKEREERTGKVAPTKRR